MMYEASFQARSSVTTDRATEGGLLHHSPERELGASGGCSRSWPAATVSRAAVAAVVAGTAEDARPPELAHEGGGDPRPECKDCRMDADERLRAGRLAAQRLTPATAC